MLPPDGARLGVKTSQGGAPLAIKDIQDEKLHDRLTRALRKYKGKPGILIAALQEAQNIFGYLPREVMIRVANELTLSLIHI